MVLGEKPVTEEPGESPLKHFLSPKVSRLLNVLQFSRTKML